jgi:N-acyl homoserine lactone hydrolase
MVGLFGLGAWQAWLGQYQAQQSVEAIKTMPFVAPVSSKTASGMRIHGIQTAWVSIKTAHYALRGPEALRFPSILADTTWTAAKPVLSWIIEHPEGLIVIDSGEQAGVRDLKSYMACADPVNQFIVVNNFRLQSSQEMELGAQLRWLGLEPNDVRFVVQSHLHFDHADGFAFVPKAKVLVARSELLGQEKVPVGAIRCKYPSQMEFTAIDYQKGAFASFAQHQTLTKAGDVLLLPTPGHSYGHQSVILRDLAHDYCFAGDVTFDEGQLKQRTIGGISHDVATARDSLERVRRYVQDNPVVYLPSHDPASLQRFASATISSF